jgi:signal transduction histidine kinase
VSATAAPRAPRPNAQRRRVLRLIAAAALPLLLLATASAWRAIQDAESRVTEERVALARAAALVAGAFVDGNLSTVRTMVHAPSLADPSNAAALGRFFEKALAENPQWEGMGIADADGWNLASGAVPPRTLYIGDRPYFQRMLATGRPIVSPAVFNRRTGNPTIVLGAPIGFDDGSRGALIVSLSTTRLAQQLQALAERPDVQAIVLDTDGQALVHPERAAEQDLVVLRGQPAADAALAGDLGYRRARDARGEDLLVAYAPVQEVGWGVLIQQPTSAAFALVRRQLIEAVGVVGLAVILTALIGWRLGGRLAASYEAEQAARAAAEAAAAQLRASVEEREAQRRFLAELIASAPVAIAVLEGPEHRHATVNPRYQAIRPGATLVGRTVAEAFPELAEQGLVRLLDHVYATGEQVTLADRPLPPAGEAGSTVPERYFTVVLARYEDAHGAPAGVLAIAPETTDAVLSRQQAEREKDEFLSTASHELKTPISSVSLSAQMIERLLAQGIPQPARLERLVAGIRTQVARATLLVNELLDVERLERGADALQHGPVDLAALAQAAAQRERDTLSEDDRHTIVCAIEAPSARVAGDEARLDQVVTNLLSNAVKYSPEGGEVRVEVVREAGQAVLRVVDHGMGIPEAERGTLFSPFGRTASARASGIAGTGLGLYISRRIVEAHGGTIAVADTPGGGTTFNVTLPALAEE